MGYKIIRFYQNDSSKRETVMVGLTKQEAQKHCKDPETHSKHCTNADGIKRTEKYGPWFDGWTEE